MKETFELFPDPVLVSRMDISSPYTLGFYPFFFLISLENYPSFSTFFVVALTFMAEIIWFVYYNFIYVSLFLLISYYFMIFSLETLKTKTKIAAKSIAISIIEVIEI